MNMELNGSIHKIFHSQTEMSRSMGWSRQRLNKVLNRKQEPSVRDVCEIADALRMKFEDVACFFVPEKSPDGDVKEQ